MTKCYVPESQVLGRTVTSVCGRRHHNAYGMRVTWTAILTDADCPICCAVSA